MKRIVFLSVLMGISISAYSQVWTPGTGILYSNPITTKVGIGMTNPSELLQVNGILKVGNSSNATDRAKGMIKIGDGSYIQIGEWEADDMLSFKANNYNFTVGRLGFRTTNPRREVHINNGNLLISRGIGSNPGSANGGILFANSTDPNCGGDWGIEYLNNAEENLHGLNFWRTWDCGHGGRNFILFLQDDGSVSIGAMPQPQIKLTVNGAILCEEVKVITNVPDADYVFEEDYNLAPLSEVETFIKENKHLPNIPSAQEFKDNGYKVGEMDEMLLRKVEELTLYIIGQEKQMNEQQKLIEALQKRLSELETKKGGK